MKSFFNSKELIFTPKHRPALDQWGKHQTGWKLAYCKKNHLVSSKKGLWNLLYQHLTEISEYLQGVFSVQDVGMYLFVNVCICGSACLVAAEWMGGLDSLSIGMHNLESCYCHLGLNEVFTELLNYIEVTGGLSSILNY